MWCVYILSDPRDLEPRYVGCTATLEHRLLQHARGARNNTGGNRLRLWEELLLQDGFLPAAMTLYTSDDERTASALEKSSIRRFAAAGARLLNVLHAPVRLSRAHQRLRGACANDVRVFRARVDGTPLGLYDAGLIWRGGCPLFRDLPGYQSEFGIVPADWLAA